MLLKRNLLETVTLISCSGTIICILLNAVTNISPITGVWLLIYILGLFIVSVFLSIRFIQWLLHLNKPLKYDLSWIESYPSLGFLRDVLPQVRVKARAGECAEYDTNELSVISTVLERKLVSSWYVPYVSEEIGFPFACKQLLDQMINKMFQICHKIETKDVFVDMCAIFITHIKEYKKALKRHEKSPTSSVDSLYKKTHPIFNSPDKKITSADHCINILRIILKELVPWELWDTPHSELLIRILAKKLDHFVDNTLSDPAWLNDKLFMLLESKSKDENIPDPKRDNVEGEKEKPVEVVKDTEAKKEPTPPPETKISSSISAAEVKMVPSLPKESKEEPKEMPEMVSNVVEETVSSQPVEIKPTAVLRQRRGRQGKNEVKIYDRIIEGSVKTWETDMDLQCISVGQDLLASLDEMNLSRLWGQEDSEQSPNLRNRSPQPLWFGEEDAIDIDHLEPSEGKEAKKENSPKATDALLKDIQSTVHQAKSKIGDLQVPLDIDVPCKHSSDEAAGMMEGLFDIGLAGIKKGLRFTGLSDDSQEKFPLHHKDRGSGKVTPPDSARQAHAKGPATEPREASHGTQKEEAGNSVPQLVKQHRVTSQDSVGQGIQPPQPREPPVPLPLPLSESPEPEYEEVADLSTSIARLRSLLQETSNRSPYLLMEGAEETAGRTHSAASGYPYSRPVDTAALADEYDMSGESPSPRQATNNMQRLDKLFQRTVTGMLNSIKTAVSAEQELQPPADWAYVVADTDATVGGAVGRLLGARRSLWQVDAALDSLQQLPPPPRAPPPPPPEDWEEWCAGEGARWSGACEAASAAGLARQHVAYRLATLLFADVGEALIAAWLEEMSAWLRAQVFVVFQRLAAQHEPALHHTLREFRPEDTCRLLRDTIPGISIFGEEAVSEAVATTVASLSHKAVNEDVIYRALDLLAVHFKKSAGLRNASFDNN